MSKSGGVGVVVVEPGQVVDDDKGEGEKKDEDMGDGGPMEEKKDAKEAPAVGCGVWCRGLGSGTRLGRLSHVNLWVVRGIWADRCAGSGGLGHGLEGEEETVPGGCCCVSWLFASAGGGVSGRSLAVDRFDSVARGGIIWNPFE